MDTQTEEKSITQFSPMNSVMAKAIIPANLGEMMELAKHLAESSLVPEALAKKPANVLVAIGAGLELGITPFQAVQNIAVINGRATLYGDMLLAVVLSHTFVDSTGRRISSVEYFQEADPGEIGKTNVAWCVVKRRGWPKEVKREFSIEDARKAGLLEKSGPWKQYPHRMLMFRARSWALRDSCPDILKGVALREEVEGFIDVPGEVIPQPKPIKSPEANWPCSPKPKSVKEKKVPEPTEEQLPIEPEIVDGPLETEDLTIDGDQRKKILDALIKKGVTKEKWQGFLSETLKIARSQDIRQSQVLPVFKWIETFKK